MLAEPQYSHARVSRSHSIGASLILTRPRPSGESRIETAYPPRGHSLRSTIERGSSPTHRGPAQGDTQKRNKSNLFIPSTVVVWGMKAVLANITVSTGGVLRLSKDLMNHVGIHPGDKLVVMREDDSVTIQFQRNDDILLRLADAKIVKS